MSALHHVFSGPVPPPRPNTPLSGCAPATAPCGHQPVVRLAAFLFAVVLAVATGSLTARARVSHTWAYVTSFRSHLLEAIDIDTDRILFALPVRDRRGRTGLAVTSDGHRLIVVDGGEQSRLRIIDPRTGQITKETDFSGRLLTPYGQPLLTLLPGNRWLFVQTRRGTRLYDLRANRFLKRTVPGFRGTIVGGSQTVACGVERQRVCLFRIQPTGALRCFRSLTLPFSIAVATALPDASRVYAASDVPRMRSVPVAHDATPAKAARSGKRRRTAASPKRRSPAHAQATPTPNPALREGPWELADWCPERGSAHLVDLVPRTDLRKVSPSPLPVLTASPDGRFLALLYGTGAWTLNPTTLDVQARLFLPAHAHGLAWTPRDGRILTVIGHGLAAIRLANHSIRELVPDGISVVGQVTIVAAPAP